MKTNKLKVIKSCGGKKKGSGCASWAGSTKLITTFKIAA